jgi:hypothetical protein
LRSFEVKSRRAVKPRAGSGVFLCVIRSRVMRSVIVLPCHPDRGSHGPSAHQGDEKRLLFGNYCPSKHRPPLCHLDRSVPGFPTSRCWKGPRVRLSLKRAACRSAKPRVVTGNPGERSGEICGSAVPSWECFSTERTQQMSGQTERSLAPRELSWVASRRVTISRNGCLCSDCQALKGFW